MFETGVGIWVTDRGIRKKELAHKAELKELKEKQISIIKTMLAKWLTNEEIEQLTGISGQKD